MPSEQRKNYIKDHVMGLAQQAMYWNDYVSSHDSSDGATEDAWESNRRYACDQYLNMIVEFFDGDWNKAAPYGGWNQVEKCKKFLAEN